MAGLSSVLGGPSFSDYLSLSITGSSHKRKQSDIPLDAVIHRSSLQMTLDPVTDEEEADLSTTPSSESSGSGLRGVSSSSVPDFEDIFPEEERSFSLRSIRSPKGLLATSLIVLIVAFVALRPVSTDAEVVAGANSAPQDGTPSVSKEITYGEFHEESVGAPQEHFVNEYNKVRYYDKIDRMKPLLSKGPVQYDDDNGGLHIFEDVCLTNNIDAIRMRPHGTTTPRGLVYFTDEMRDNPKRCVPCSNSDPLEGWDDTHEDEKVVGHKCGMNGLHAMFASSVGDWSDCIMEKDNFHLMAEYKQTQSPTEVTTVHYFLNPTFLLQFDALDTETSLFDMLMTYIPHWDKFFRGGDDFPFDSVISHSLEGCLSHSHHWVCEVLHQIGAFGMAKEIVWEPDDLTLYCYRQLYYNQVGYNRNLDREGHVTRENFGEFREVLFRKFGLPRRRTVKDRKSEAEIERRNGNPVDNSTKIIFLDNKISDQAIWSEMDSLISTARSLEKFQNFKFVTIRNLSDLTVAQQARAFNEADAIIMAHGQHMANAIFAVDGTSFVEVGCKVSSLISNPKFMKLMDGKYRAVEACDEKGGICVDCERISEESNFSMTMEAFEELIDATIATLGSAEG